MKKRKTPQQANQRESIQVHDRGALLEKWREFKRLFSNLNDLTLDQYQLHLNKFFDWLKLDNPPQAAGPTRFSDPSRVCGCIRTDP